MIIIDVSSSADKALFGKMLWVMMAVLEDIQLWTCVYYALTQHMEFSTIWRILVFE